MDNLPCLPGTSGRRQRQGEGDRRVNGLSKGIRKVEIALKWDPVASGQPPTDLDLVAAPYLATPLRQPRLPGALRQPLPYGTITSTVTARTARARLGRGHDARTRAPRRALRARGGRRRHTAAPGRRTFASVANPALRIREGYTVLAEDDFGTVPGATAADGRGVRTPGIRPLGLPPGPRGLRTTRRPSPRPWARRATPDQTQSAVRSLRDALYRNTYASHPGRTLRDCRHCERREESVQAGEVPRSPSVRWQPLDCHCSPPFSASASAFLDRRPGHARPPALHDRRVGHDARPRVGTAGSAVVFAPESLSSWRCPESAIGVLVLAPSLSTSRSAPCARPR
ncbi:hypothetical protein SALBM217S_04274 [Streptomyces griseoloalbus]